VVLAGAGIQTTLLLVWHQSMAQLIAAQCVAMSLLLIAVTISHFLPTREAVAVPAALDSSLSQTPLSDVAQADVQ
jgi:hypothetical protein